MALTNTEFENITRILEDRRRSAEQKFYAEMEALDEKEPRLRELSLAIRANATARAKAKILHDDAELLKLVSERETLLASRDALRKTLGLTETDLSPRYTCPICHDTGYVNGQKCVCFLKEERELLLEKTHAKSLLLNENFEALTMAYYDRTPGKNGEPSEYERMEKAILRVRNFVNTFDETPSHLFLFGPPGSGKSFLSHCAAKALVDAGKKVVYYSSITLFETISMRLSQNSPELSKELSEELLESDLLIIDDLGTELLNGYTNGKFFQIINERLMNGKPMIISSNLMGKQL